MTDFIIIPAYNEGKRVAEAVNKAQVYLPNVIVVDDGSQDDTSEQARQAGAKVLRHQVNLGKGAALKTGCEYVLTQGAEKIVVMDGDGQHNPKEIPALLNALDGHDIVFTYRQVPDSMPLILQFGNKFISQTLKLLYHINVKDTQCGYRAFTASAYSQIKWGALDYYVESEMIINAGKKKLKYNHVPIETIYTDRYKGTTVIDGFLIVAKMFGGRLLR